MSARGGHAGIDLTFLCCVGHRTRPAVLRTARVRSALAIGRRAVVRDCRRGAVQVFLKHVADNVAPRPNHTLHEWAPWDAFIHAPDPDAVAAEFEGGGIAFHQPLGDRDDGLRGFEMRDPDGYVLFFGRPIQQ